MIVRANNKTKAFYFEKYGGKVLNEEPSDKSIFFHVEFEKGEDEQHFTKDHESNREVLIIRPSGITF